MSIPKIIGLEQEYAMQFKGGSNLSAFEVSCLLINSYARKIGLRKPGQGLLWDYAHETPYQDIRGALFRKSAFQQIVGEEDNRRINAPLPNGARLYTDHGHPEYSTPECLSARQALACDKAGEVILTQALEAMKAVYPELRLRLFKNNSDHQGHSYGCHENYLMDATDHQAWLVENPHWAARVLIPFLVTRQVMAGAGKVGSEGSARRGVLYQVSQRADFMENLFGLETMYARPIINTRAEHHADAGRFRRLHLIMGDANLCETAAFLKLGTTQIVLKMMEDHFIREDLTLQNPLKAIRQVSTAFDHPLEMSKGPPMTALQIQRRLLERAEAYQYSDAAAQLPDYGLIVERWAKVLDGLEGLKLSTDLDIEDDPGDLIRKLDWVLKLWLLNRYRHSRNCGWDHPWLQVLDLHYHGLDDGEGLFYHLQADGMTDRLIADAEIGHFVDQAPEDTRAWFRSRCIQKFAAEILWLNWEVVGFNHGNVHRMIPLLNPLQGTRDQFEGLFAEARNSVELISRLESTGI